MQYTLRLGVFKNVSCRARLYLLAKASSICLLSCTTSFPYCQSCHILLLYPPRDHWHLQGGISLPQDLKPPLLLTSRRVEWVERAVTHLLYWCCSRRHRPLFTQARPFKVAEHAAHPTQEVAGEEEVVIREYTQPNIIPGTLLMKH